MVELERQTTAAAAAAAAAADISKISKWVCVEIEEIGISYSKCDGYKYKYCSLWGWKFICWVDRETCEGFEGYIK